MSSGHVVLDALSTIAEEEFHSFSELDAYDVKEFERKSVSSFPSFVFPLINDQQLESSPERFVH